jgi:hypothetical protein
VHGPLCEPCREHDTGEVLVVGAVAAHRGMRRFLLIVAMVAVLLPLWAEPARADEVVHGYVLATQPGTVNYIANSGYEFNSTGGVIEISRAGAGQYMVRFAGMATSGGIAHVQHYGSLNNGMCTVTSWGSPFMSPDLYVNVRCFNAAGFLTDSRFVAHFTNRTVAEGRFAYLWADHPNNGPYLANVANSYDSTGVRTIVQRHDVGVYKVYLNAALGLHGTAAFGDGHLQVTAYNASAVRCAGGIDDDEDPIAVTVVCRDADGDPTNSKFVLSYSHDVSHLGTDDPHGNAIVSTEMNVASVWAWTGTGDEPTAVRASTGVYQVKFGSLAMPKGHAIAHALGSFHYCHVASWLGGIGGEEVVNVRCVNSLTGLQADIAFGVSFTG